MSTQHQYTVVWKIQVDAANAFDAAKQAQAIQRDLTSTATLFHIHRQLNASDTPVVVDLLEANSDPSSLRHSH